MSPFEAHILISQSSPSPACSAFPNRGESETSCETALRQALASHRLNPNVHFKRETFLATAIKRNCSNLVKLFLEHGADPNLKSYENGRYEPALITAVRYKSLRSVKILLEHGANPGKTNFYGSDAIFQAVHENAFEILEYILEHGSSVPPNVLSATTSSSSCPRPHHSQSCHNPTARKFLERELAKEGASLPSKNNGPTFNNSCNNGKGQDGENDEHVLCPFFYALNSGLVYPRKRASVGLLLQSYYKCKCILQLGSNCSDFPSIEEDNQVKECLRLVGDLKPENFWPSAGARNESTLGNSGSDDSVQQEYDYHTHHHHPPPENADNENNIKFCEELYPRHSLKRKLYPYKLLKIRGKCHAIKENESSADAASSSYVALVGPLKLSCIARELIRDEIMRCLQPIKKAQTSYISTGDDHPNETAWSTVASQNSDRHGNLIVLKSNRDVLHEDYLNKVKASFQKSLQTLMIPSSLMDYILYKNVNWSGASSAGEIERRVGSWKIAENGNNERESCNNIDNIKLIKREVELNINYFAIYIY